MKMLNLDALITKYDQPVPRYTSYPTVPDWDAASFEHSDYRSWIKGCFDEHGEEGLSLYIHLPYCERLCTYCGCNTRITVNHEVEGPYIQAVLEEWRLYVDQFGKKPLVKEIHLGGGTPTFFSPEHLTLLIQGILDQAILHSQYEFSFEGHPNNTTYEHLKVLNDLGFTRVSYGIQDFDLKVQKAINRVQGIEQVRKVTQWSRELGYTSINFDLIYGLPFQTEASIEQTIDYVSELMPERIAFYSYAHVPWKRPGQRAYSEKDLPNPQKKRILNELGRKRLQALGYGLVGMDHFALKDDTLFTAMHNGTLHRNFMGYTTQPGKILVGLGTSSISDWGEGYSQNCKTVEGYIQHIDNQSFAIFKGHLTTVEEQHIKRKVMQVACQKQFELEHDDEKLRLTFEEMQNDGLLYKDGTAFRVTEIGNQLLRNICAVFDPNMDKHQKEQLFSRAV